MIGGRGERLTLVELISLLFYRYILLEEYVYFHNIIFFNLHFELKHVQMSWKNMYHEILFSKIDFVVEFQCTLQHLKCCLTFNILIKRKTIYHFIIIYSFSKILMNDVLELFTICVDKSSVLVK